MKMKKNGAPRRMQAAAIGGAEPAFPFTFEREDYKITRLPFPAASR